MARKKKITKKVKTVVDAKVQSLDYQGKVKLQVLHGDKIISTKDYTNSGLPCLFKYISYALAGQNYSDLRPCKIVIFKCPTDGHLDKPNNFDWDTVYNNTLKVVSPIISYDATPIVQITKTNDNKIKGYATTFRFKVPFNWLYSKEFNVIGLFTDSDEACAYYLCTKDSTTTDEDGNSQTTKVWDTQPLDDITGNFSLIIEWTMEISNKNA